MYLEALLKKKFQQEESKFLELASVLEKQKKERAKQVEEEMSERSRLKSSEPFDSSFPQGLYLESVAAQLNISSDKLVPEKLQKSDKLSSSGSLSKEKLDSRFKISLSESIPPKSISGYSAPKTRSKVISNTSADEVLSFPSPNSLDTSSPLGGSSPAASSPSSFLNTSNASGNLSTSSNALSSSPSNPNQPSNLHQRVNVKNIRELLKNPDPPK